MMKIIQLYSPYRIKRWKLLIKLKIFNNVKCEFEVAGNVQWHNGRNR